MRTDDFGRLRGMSASDKSVFVFLHFFPIVGCEGFKALEQGVFTDAIDDQAQGGE